MSSKQQSAKATTPAPHTYTTPEKVIMDSMGISQQEFRSLRDELPQEGNWHLEQGNVIVWSPAGMAALEALIFKKKSAPLPAVPYPATPPPTMAQAIKEITAMKPPPVRLIPREKTLNTGIVLADRVGHRGRVRLRCKDSRDVKLNQPVWARLLREPDLYEIHPDARNLDHTHATKKGGKHVD